jgi:hypothetical protein
MIIAGQEKDMARQGKANNHHHHHYHHATTDRPRISSFLMEIFLQSNLGLYVYSNLHWVCMMEKYCRQHRYRLAQILGCMLLLAFDRENINLVDKITYHSFFSSSSSFSFYLTNQPAF